MKWVEVITRLHKIPVSRKMAAYLVLMAAYTIVVCWIDSDHLKRLIQASGAMYGSMVMGVLLVFRTNSAYDRWWEGRKLWGQLVNDTRNLSIKVANYAQIDDNEKAQFGALLYTFALSLKMHLRSDTLSLHQVPGFEKCQDAPNNVPVYIADAIYQRLAQWQSEKKVTEMQMLQIDPHARALMDIVGACERIVSSPIALSYRAILRQGITLNLLSIPWIVAPDFDYWAIPIALIAAYFMIGLELIAEDIEEPFGVGEDNLALDAICATIERSVKQVLNAHKVCSPDLSVLETAGS